jgi:hypothetical protein
MEYLITVYRYDKYEIPVAEIRWTGEFTQNPNKFARLHGGDFITIEERDEVYAK